MRDYTVKHVIVLTLSLGLAGADALATGIAVPTLGAPRFEPVTTQHASLPAGATGTHYLPFTAGREYHVVAGCAEPCGDMTLRLSAPDGRDIDRRNTPSTIAEVATIPSGRGRYRVDVHMASCRAAACRYALQVIAR